MKRYVVHLLFCVFLLFQTQCAQPPAPQEACGFVQNSYGQRISWKGTRPIKLYFDSSVPTQYYDAIRKAAQTWEAAIGYPIFQFVGTISSGRLARDTKNVIYWQSPWDNGNASQQGETVVYWYDTQILETDVRVNDQDFDFAINATAGRVIDVQALFTHELGHVLGLRHEDSISSVMKSSLEYGVQRDNLSSFDQKNVKCEY